MGLYGKCREEWNDKMKVGDGKTVQDMYFTVTGNASTNMNTKDRSSVSSFMSNAISKGYARKESNTRPAVYIKVKSVPARGGPRLNRKPKLDKEIDMLQLGTAIHTLIDNLTQKNKELRDRIATLNAELGDAIEAKRQIEDLYQKSQERVLELNQAKGKGRKTLNLHELQSLTRQ